LVLSAFALVDQAQPPRDKPAPAGTGSIVGRVVAAETGGPVRKARVTAEADVGRVPPVFTDAEGRFTIAGLAAARYTLSAAKPGYANTVFRRQDGDAPPSRIDVAADARVDAIEVRMPRAAAIS